MNSISKSRGFGRTIIGAAVTTAAALALSVGATAPAHASAGTGGGVGTTSASCGYSGVYRQVTIRPQTGFNYNQLVGYHMYVKDLTTGATTWTGWTTFYASQSMTSWIYPTTNHNYQFYMEYAWYNGSKWSYAGEWLTSYIHRTGSSYSYTPYCYEW